jgi:hypothetical protein
MDNDSDMMEERQTVVRRLLDAYFGRTARSEAKTKEDIVPMGGPTRSDKSLAQKSFETRWTLARSVQTDSYRGIALSGFRPTPSGIIQLGGVVRLVACFEMASGLRNPR